MKSWATYILFLAAKPVVPLRIEAWTDGGVNTGIADGRLAFEVPSGAVERRLSVACLSCSLPM